MIPLKDNLHTKRFPMINYLLIFLNGILFIYEIYLASQGRLEGFISAWGAKPFQLINHPIAEAKTLITNMFLHGGWAHFLGNMLYLHIFGDNMEDKLGHLKYLLFYIFCGIMATLAQVLLSYPSDLPLIGASGAIAGVLGGYLIFFPHARVLTVIPFGLFLRIIYLPAFIFLGFWFFLQMSSGVLSIGRGYISGIAWWAHISGFLTGLIIAIRVVKFRRRFKTRM